MDKDSGPARNTCYAKIRAGKEQNMHGLKEPEKNKVIKDCRRQKTNSLPRTSV